MEKGLKETVLGGGAGREGGRQQVEGCLLLGTKHGLEGQETAQISVCPPS